MIKKMKLILIILVICSFFTGCSPQKTSTTPEITPPAVNIKSEGTVVILATGGTIAGSGEIGKETGYKSGSLSVDSLIAAVPGIEKIANIEAIQVCNYNTSADRSDIDAKLAERGISSTEVYSTYITLNSPNGKKINTKLFGVDKNNLSRIIGISDRDDGHTFSG